MARNVLIFSDGTGQIGGIRPDQRLSNVYKMYRAMRPGPSSPIDPVEQFAFYDPGLGAGETDGMTLRRVANGVEAAIGSGIDENVIDCYEAIIANYEPGDRVLLFGFSRGAYTVRSVANVMNLCGVPTQLKDGSPVPRAGPVVRKIATDAVKYVYNHGAGKPRGEEPYFSEREEKGRRFRAKYGSAPPEGELDVQGNVQPTFIGVFDTVAALGNPITAWILFGSFLTVLGVAAWCALEGWWIWSTLFGAAAAALTVRYIMLRFEQWKYTSPPGRTLRYRNPGDWLEIARRGHRAYWTRKNYDRWLDSDVGHARHALAIDERRESFARVKWATAGEARKNEGKSPAWLSQVWFAGCHSDIGGSYPESESRLSDIALDWMVDELRECVPLVTVRDDILHRFPDATGLLHEETHVPGLGPLRVPWKSSPREVNPRAPLHATVLERLAAGPVPQGDRIEPYRPPELVGHEMTRAYYDDPDALTSPTSETFQDEPTDERSDDRATPTT